MNDPADGSGWLWNGKEVDKSMSKASANGDANKNFSCQSVRIGQYVVETNDKKW